MRQCTKRLWLSKRITANDNKICVLYNCAFLLHKKPQLHSPKGVQNGKFCPICLLKSRNMIIKREPCFCGNTLRFFGKGTAHGTLCQKIRWKKACANNKNCAHQSRFTGNRKPTPIIQKNTVVKVRYAFHLDKIKLCKEFIFFAPFPFRSLSPWEKGKRPRNILSLDNPFIKCYTKKRPRDICLSLSPQQPTAKQFTGRLFCRVI